MSDALRVSAAARGLIYDLDGTLLDSLEVNWQGMDRALRRRGLLVEREEFIALTGRSLPEIVAELLRRHGGEPSWAPALVSEKQRYANAHAADIRLIEAVARLARESHGRLPQCVGTGSDRQRALLMLESAGLLGLFDHVVSADEVERHKPNPDTFLRCAQLMGVPPDRCQVFEDGVMGLEAARRAGMIVTDVRPYI